MFTPNYNLDSFFTLDTYIDAVQTIKSGLVNKIVTDPTLNKAANDFISAQTSFAKMLTKNFTELSKYSADSIAKTFFPKKEDASVSKQT